MSTNKSKSTRAKSRDTDQNQISPKVAGTDYEKILVERNQLRDELERKNEEIEKLTAAIMFAGEHLSKAIDCLQEVSRASATNGKHSGSPKTPNQHIKPARKLGPDGVLKRSASNFDDPAASESYRPLKRSYMSAPEHSSFEDS